MSVRTVAASIAVAVVAATGTACSNSSSASGPRADTVSAPSATASGQTTGQPPTKAQITRALWTVQDMPTGYTIDRSKDSGPNNSGCPGIDQLHYRRQAVARGEASFTKGTFGPYASEDIDAMPNNQAHADLVAFEHAVSACRHVTVPQGSGQKPANGTITPLSFPQLGDETFAFQLQLSGLELVGSAQADFAAVRVGPTLVLGDVTAFLASPDADLLASLLKKSVNRLHGA